MNSISSNARPARGHLPSGERAGPGKDQHAGRGKDQHAGRSAPIGI